MKKTDNKQREIMKRLKNGIWRARGFFLKKRLLVGKIKWMVALRTNAFVSVSNEVQPYKKVCVK